MLKVTTENIGDLAIIECQGRLEGKAVLKLRDAVTGQGESRTVVLELSEVSAIADWGLGTLAYLQQWARDHEVRLKLFNPSRSLRDKLEHSRSVSKFPIATLDEMADLMSGNGYPYAPPAA